MENAGLQIVKALKAKFPEPWKEKIVIVAGKGNNGGDGLAISRMLLQHGYECKTFLIRYSDNLSKDAETNFNRFKEKYPLQLFEINEIIRDARGKNKKTYGDCIRGIVES